MINVKVSVFTLRLIVLQVCSCFKANAQITRQMFLLGKPTKNLDSLEHEMTIKHTPIEKLKILLLLEEMRFKYKQTDFGRDFERIEKLYDEKITKNQPSVFYYFKGLYEQYFTKNLKYSGVWYLKALDGFSQNTDTVGMIRTCVNLASINVDNYGNIIGDTTSMLKYVKLALFLSRKIQCAECLIIANRALSAYYYMLPKREKSFHDFERVQYETINLARSETKLNDYEVVAVLNLSASYIERKLYEKALKLMQTLLNGKLDSQPANVKRTFYINMAEVYYFLNRYKLSEKYLTSALNVSPLTLTLSEKSTIYDFYKELAIVNRDYKKALAFSDSVVNINNEMFSLENAKRINDIQIKYHTKEKELQNNILFERNKLVESRNNILWDFLGIALFFLFLVAILIVLVVRLNIKLTKINTSREKLISIIAHDLRTPSTIFRDFTGLIYSLLTNNKFDEIQQVAEEVERNGIKIEQLLSNLLHWGLYLNDKLPYYPEVYNISAQINNTISLYMPVFNLRKLTLEVNMLPDIYVFADPEGMSVVVRNLIDNAVKFMPSNGRMYIATRLVDESAVEIQFTNSVADFYNQNILVINSILKGENKNGKMENRSGLGLQLIAEFASINCAGISAQYSGIANEISFNLTMKTA